jgi:hypothetical protein
MFGRTRRGGLRGARCAQQSTAFAGPSQNSGNLAQASGVAVRVAQSERVSCICSKAIRWAVCPSGSRLAPLMWSRAAAARRGICAYFRATSSCRMGGASIFLGILGPISAVRRRPAHPTARLADRATAAKARPKMAKNAVPPGRKKLWLAPEPPAATAVEGLGAGRSPQPLTLNHPASNPGRVSDRGSPFLFSFNFYLSGRAHDFLAMAAISARRPGTRHRAGRCGPSWRPSMW